MSRLAQLLSQPIKVSGPVVLEAGKYQGKVTDFTFSDNKKGNKQLVITFQVAGVTLKQYFQNFSQAEIIAQAKLIGCSSLYDLPKLGMIDLYITVESEFNKVYLVNPMMLDINKEANNTAVFKGYEILDFDQVLGDNPVLCAYIKAEVNGEIKYTFNSSVFDTSSQHTQVKSLMEVSKNLERLGRQFNVVNENNLLDLSVLATKVGQTFTYSYVKAAKKEYVSLSAQLAVETLNNLDASDDDNQGSY